MLPGSNQRRVDPEVALQPLGQATARLVLTVHQGDRRMAVEVPVPGGELILVGMRRQAADGVAAGAHLDLLAEDADEIGTVEAGKLADLIAVRGDPVEDVSRLQNVDWVMRAGAVYKAGLPGTSVDP